MRTSCKSRFLSYGFAFREYTWKGWYREEIQRGKAIIRKMANMLAKIASSPITKIVLLLVIIFAVSIAVVHAYGGSSGTPPKDPIDPTITTSKAMNPSFQDFVNVCGTQLCIGGKPWKPYFASTYDASLHLTWDINTAAQGHLNTLRINNFLDNDGNPQTAPYDEARWQIVDKLIASARAKGLHVILDLSAYRNLTTQNDTHNPYLVDWKPFLTFVINRVNTVTKVRYGEDTTIALFDIAGEVAPPNGTNPSHETTLQITSFFARTAREFKAFDHHHLLSTGGLYQLNWNSGIDYKTLFSNPNIDVCAVHSPPTGADAVITAQFCERIHKPWLWEEFFEPQSVGDQARAQFFQQTYTAGTRLHDAGIGFWNLGPGIGATNDDVGPQTPLTWQVVINNAPNS
jgi:hypothetical protein